ncbi:MAG: ACP S-malonyltransferase [bacterium]|nr:ACP S-malonyltransferase [bacterium]
MSGLGIVFAGQGSQFVGMGKELAAAESRVNAYFDRASEVSGRDIKRICFEGPEDELVQTDNAQLGIFVISAALYELVNERTPLNPAFLAGHSLGELTAYYVAGVLDFDSALKVVDKRGSLMRQAAVNQPGAMSAILGMDAAKIESVIAPIDGAVIANYNAPIQTVISGTKDGVFAAGEALSKAGAKRVVPLKVGGAFHTEQMAGAAEGLAAFIEGIDFHDARIPIVLNRTAQKETSAAALKANLPEQVKSPVRWTQSIQSISGEVTRITEFGPGKVLGALIKKIAPEIECDSMNSDVFLEKLEV